MNVNNTHYHLTCLPDIQLVFTIYPFGMQPCLPGPVLQTWNNFWLSATRERHPPYRWLYCFVCSRHWCRYIFLCFRFSVVSDVNGKQMCYDRGSTLDSSSDSRGGRKKLLLIDILSLVSRAISTWADLLDWKFSLQRYCVSLRRYVHKCLTF